MKSRIEHLYSLHLLFLAKSNFKTVVDVGVKSFKYLENYLNVFDTVIGIEANKQMYLEIKKQLPVENVKLINKCLSNKKDKTTFFSCNSDPGYSTISETRYNTILQEGIFTETDFTKETVDTCKLDDLDLLKNLKIDLIKIDAESEDINIFFGSIQTIINNRPVLQIEHVYYEPEADNFFKKLEEIEYIEMKPYFKSRNYFFIPKENLK